MSKPMECKCKAWYEGKPISFCPWCGKKLIPVKASEISKIPVMPPPKTTTNFDSKLYTNTGENWKCVKE